MECRADRRSAAGPAIGERNSAAWATSQ